MKHNPHQPHHLEFARTWFRDTTGALLAYWEEKVPASDQRMIELAKDIEQTLVEAVLHGDAVFAESFFFCCVGLSCWELVACNSRWRAGDQWRALFQQQTDKTLSLGIPQCESVGDEILEMFHRAVRSRDPQAVLGFCNTAIDPNLNPWSVAVLNTSAFWTWLARLGYTGAAARGPRSYD